MAVMCAWASIGENGKITGGKPGDQTGREVKCGAIYDFGQTRVYRCKDRDKALAIGAAAHAMAINNMFGYNQSNRTTSFTELKKVKWVVADVKTPCNIDCSEMGACAVNVAYKYSLISSSVYSGNIGKALLNTGYFKELKDSKYLGKSEYIQCGDIIVAPGKHVIIAYTDGSKVNVNSVSTIISNAVGGGNKYIKLGQQHAINFTGVKIQVDGKVGNETKKMKQRVLQHAINLDYKSKLVEDGIFGSASKKALGNHYVEYGEKQYMVTALEILLYLNGYDPNGVELPGEYGNGVVKAVRNKFGGFGTKVTSDKFLSLIS